MTRIKKTDPLKNQVNVARLPIGREVGRHRIKDNSRYRKMQSTFNQQLISQQTLKRKRDLNLSPRIKRSSQSIKN